MTTVLRVTIQCVWLSQTMVVRRPLRQTPSTSGLCSYRSLTQGHSVRAAAMPPVFFRTFRRRIDRTSPKGQLCLPGASIVVEFAPPKVAELPDNTGLEVGA